MQLKAKTPYTNMYFTLAKNEETTNRPDITEAHKRYLVETFPADFDIIEIDKPAPEPKEFKIETPEAKLNIEAREVKIETKQVGRPKKVK